MEISKPAIPDCSFTLLSNQHLESLPPISSPSDSDLLKSRFVSLIAESMRSLECRLLKSIRILNNEEDEVGETDRRERREAEEEQRIIWEKRMTDTVMLAEEVESRIRMYVESSEKKKRELERIVTSLTEENSDINGFLRVALLEREVAEKKQNEQKRSALMEIAEKGLQRVGFGFGFRFGFTSGSAVDGSNQCNQEEEEEEDSVVKMIEKTMKNLRHEISELRSSLDESISGNERLERLTEKQSQKLEENTMYINQLEQREKLLSQNVEELLIEVKEAEAEVSRWREACVLEVEAGRLEVDECNRMISILKAELEKVKSAWSISEGKMKLKEEVTRAAMAAEEAAEKSLRLADRRAVELLSRIECLTRQLEETDSLERSRREQSHRRCCWPWRPWRVVTSAAKYASTRCGINRGASLADTRALLQDDT